MPPFLWSLSSEPFNSHTTSRASAVVHMKVWDREVTSILGCLSSRLNVHCVFYPTACNIYKYVNQTIPCSHSQPSNSFITYLRENPRSFPWPIKYTLFDPGSLSVPTSATLSLHTIHWPPSPHSGQDTMSVDTVKICWAPATVARYSGHLEYIGKHHKHHSW